MTRLREYIGYLTGGTTLLWLLVIATLARFIINAIDRLSFAIIESAGLVAQAIVESAALR